MAVTKEQQAINDAKKKKQPTSASEAAGQTTGEHLASNFDDVAEQMEDAIVNYVGAKAVKGAIARLSRGDFGVVASQMVSSYKSSATGYMLTQVQEIEEWDKNPKLLLPSGGRSNNLLLVAMAPPAAGIARMHFAYRNTIALFTFLVCLLISYGITSHYVNSQVCFQQISQETTNDCLKSSTVGAKSAKPKSNPHTVKSSHSRNGSQLGRNGQSIRHRPGS